MDKISVRGMSCEHCAASVKGALEGLGLQNVQVDLASGVASFGETDMAKDKIAAAIDDIGFELA